MSKFQPAVLDIFKLSIIIITVSIYILVAVMYVILYIL